MQELQEFYRQRLLSRISVLEEAQQQLKQAPSLSAAEAAEAMGTIRRLAHSLRSSGTTYGYPEVTEDALAVENASDEDILLFLNTLLVTLRIVAMTSKGSPENVLVIENDPELCRQIQQAIGKDNRCIFVARTAEQARQLLVRERNIHLIVLDLLLPMTDGRDLLIEIREQLSMALIPVIVLSARGIRTQAECFVLGADVYLEKPVDFQVLDAAVQAQFHRYYQSQEDARQDSLTNLPNRRACEEEYLRVTSFCAREHMPLTIGVLDFDGFQHINNTFGLVTGDRAMHQALDLVRDTLRRSDFLARWEDDQFVILLPDTRVPGAIQAMDKSVQAMREQVFNAEDGQTFHVSFSIGLAQVAEGMALGDAVAEATQYLQKAKQNGRGTIQPAEDQLLRPARRRTIVLIEDDELVASIVEYHLKRENYEILHYTSGKEALALMPMSHPESLALILLDVKMPGGVDGFEVLKHLRNAAGFTQIPIVMLTSMGNDQDIVRSFLMGADDYVLKPFSPPELVARVQRLLNRFHR